MTSGIGDIRFLIEFSDNFFKHGPHRVVIQSRQFYTAIRVEHRTAAEVNGRVNKLGNQKPQNVMLGKLARYLVIIREERITNVYARPMWT